MNGGFSSWIEDGRLPALLAAGRGLLLLALGAAAVLLAARPARGLPPGPRRDLRRACVLVGLLLAAVLAYQATWQLSGFLRPPFVDFLRQYNRRPTLAGQGPRRGRIMDRNGFPLAANDPAQPGRRFYPLGPAAVHVVGYDDPLFGLAGVEAAGDAALSGLVVDSAAALDRFGRNLFDHARARGNDVRLTLDARLQRTAAALLDGRRGALVALDPRDGAILALASAPAYDPAALETALADESGAAPALNRALQGVYPPGSAFKIVVAAAAIGADATGPHLCPAGGFVPAPRARPIRDHEYYAWRRAGRAWPGHGRIDLERAFVLSANTYFAQAGILLGPEPLAAAARRAGFGRPFELAEGSSGVLVARPSRFPAKLSVRTGEPAQAAIGQGPLLVTPLHMALVAAAVARGGVAPQPRIEARARERTLGRWFDADAAGKLATMMRKAVAEGTGRHADVPGLEVAGKTGTAQNPHGDDHAWFVGFAPASRPAVAFAVLVENGGSGGTVAAPLAGRFLRVAEGIALLTPPGGRAGKDAP